MNYSQIREYDVANGEGIRKTLFVSGCTFGCKGCFNEEYWDFNCGLPWDKNIEDEFIQCKPFISGYTILGGEPLQQDMDLLHLLDRLKFEHPDKSIWLYTGYTFENIPNDKLEILNYVDVLVDGLFDITKKDVRLKFRGSTNQRIINVKETKKQNKIIEFFN